MVVALLGANGAGKSSLLRTISGLLRPWSGRILLDGEDLRPLSPDTIARRGVAHVPEGRGLFPDMTVRENLELACEGRATVAMAEGLERAEALFPVLAERRAQRVGTLSGGEQQMLAIARSLCRQPRLLMLDEMSQGLAPIIVAELFERVATIRNSGTTVLLVEQFAAAALRLADVVYVMEKGRITFSGTPAALAADPHAMREAYLGRCTGNRHRLGEADRPTEEVRIRISPATRRAYESLAAARGTTIGEQIREALARHLEAAAIQPKDSAPGRSRRGPSPATTDDLGTQLLN
jgi:branched-chain amino acid transport system ATP-binding protein